MKRTVPIQKQSTDFELLMLLILFYNFPTFSYVSFLVFDKCHKGESFAGSPFRRELHDVRVIQVELKTKYFKTIHLN
jgi:hypothetical protein